MLQRSVVGWWSLSRIGANSVKLRSCSDGMEGVAMHSTGTSFRCKLGLSNSQCSENSTLYHLHSSCIYLIRMAFDWNQLSEQTSIVKPVDAILLQYSISLNLVLFTMWYITISGYIQLADIEGASMHPTETEPGCELGLWNSSMIPVSVYNTFIIFPHS